MHERLMNGVMVLLAVVAAAELAYAFATRKPVHTLRDTLSSVSLGIGQQAINAYLAASFLAVYEWVHANWAPIHADRSVVWHWALLIVACDFCYYVGHRTSHNVNFWVAAHIVHHQAEDFNHLSAFRQSWTAWMVMFPFFLPLALFGVPVDMFVIGQMGIMCIQFLSHNGAFRGQLGMLDRLLVTPANHRVHHGINGPYLGANCGGMFVIWDRVFGTFVEEDPNIPIRMGSGIRMNFYDPFEANVDYYRRLWTVARHRRGLGKLTLWFQSPRVLKQELMALGRRDVGEPLVRDPLSPRGRLAAGAALAACVALLAVHRASFDGNPVALRLLTGASVLFALGVLGRLLSGPGAVNPAVSTAAAK